MVKRAPYKRLILGSNPSGTTGFVSRRRSVKPLTWVTDGGAGREVQFLADPPISSY